MLILSGSPRMSLLVRFTSSQEGVTEKEISLDNKSEDYVNYGSLRGAVPSGETTKIQSGDVRRKVQRDTSDTRVSVAGRARSMPVERRKAKIAKAGALRSPIPRFAGLLLPSLNVHSDYEKPQGQRCFPEDAGDHDVREQIARERR